MLDNGAEANIIQQATFLRMAVHPEISPYRGKMMGWDGNKTDILGWARMHVSLAGRLAMIPFVIMWQSICEVILGGPALRMFGAQVDLVSCELECLLAVWITKKLRHLISFSPFKLELNTDHRGLVMLLMKKELGNAWLECWAMHLQPLCM
eukprot:m51a1_g1527 hypothetical protein (151) ;mRNA; f:486893-494472